MMFACNVDISNFTHEKRLANHREPFKIHCRRSIGVCRARALFFLFVVNGTASQSRRVLFQL